MKGTMKGLHFFLLSTGVLIITFSLRLDAQKKIDSADASIHHVGIALAPLRLFTPTPFQRAITKGTRTMTGAPGPRYWQNSANYDIRVTITPADSLLRGEETITYFNRSPDTLKRVRFHLYQNLIGPNRSRLAFGAFIGWTDGMVIEGLEVGKRPVQVQVLRWWIPWQKMADSSAIIVGTYMDVPLPQPLLPSDSLHFHITWHFTIFPNNLLNKMGMLDSTTAQVAQWYPQIAVYDDIHGWDREQYTGVHEFYLDYGHFKYTVTLPAGYIVGGSGRLTNPDQVLTPKEREALARAAASDAVVPVLTAADFGPGTATRGGAGTQLTWMFEADSVRDVAFCFSDHYLWDAAQALVDSSRGRRVLVNVLHRAGVPWRDDVALVARSALETHSRRMVPYPYPQLTVAGDSRSMEYPMIVFIPASTGLYSNTWLTSHEIGHQWFPMLVGSNESRYEWQDEGLATFAAMFATDEYRPDSLKGRLLREAQQNYLSFVSRVDEDLQIMSPANSFVVPDDGSNEESYWKTSAALWALRASIGGAVFDEALGTYIQRWSYKHPTPWDFFHTFNNATGQDLDWFWRPWFFTRDKLDQSIVLVNQRGQQVSVTVENNGGLYAAVDFTVTLENGKTESWREPASVWFKGGHSVTSTHRVSGRVVGVELDRDHNFPDTNRENNVWPKK